MYSKPVQSLVPGPSPLGRRHRELAALLLAVGGRVGRHLAVGHVVLGGDGHAQQRLHEGLVLGTDHRVGAPALLLLLDLADDDVVEFVRPEGHLVDGLDDLAVALLLVLVVLGEEVEEGREAALLVLEHDALQLALQVVLLEQHVAADGAGLHELVAVLLLVRSHLLLGEADAEELDDGAEQVVDLLEEEVDRQRHDLQVGAPRPLRLPPLLGHPLGTELHGQLADLLLQEVVLPLQLLYLQQQELLLLVRTDVLLARVQRHQRGHRRTLRRGRLRLARGLDCEGGGGHLGGVELGLLCNFLPFHSKTIMSLCSDCSAGSDIYYMLVIAYAQTDHLQVPPVFLQLDEKAMVATTEEVIGRVYAATSRFLSPFVTPAHLELRLSDGEVLFRKIPLFLYFNYGCAQQHLFFAVRAKEAIAADNYKYDELFLNLFTRVSHRSPSPLHRTHHYQERLRKFRVLSKSEAMGIEEMCAEILPTDGVIIGGKRITLGEGAEWGRVLREKWEQLENIRDRCLYVCIDRSD